MNRLDQQTPLQIVAYREAGHAVACYLLRRRFGHVTTKPGEERPGNKTYPKKTNKAIPSEKELATIRREYVVSFAGPIAVGIFSGRCEFEDMLPLIGLAASPTTGSHKLELALWKTVFVETKLLLYAPRNWQAVMALAAELLKQETIRYQTAREVIKQAMEDYDAGVRDDISALHHSRYSEFVKGIADEKTRFKERVNDIYLRIAGGYRESDKSPKG